MADKRIGILLEADADLEAIKEGKSALEDFSKRGILGMERLEQRVALLQRATVNLRKEIEQNRTAQNNLNKAIDTGSVSVAEAAKMNDSLIRREKELQAALKQSQFSYRTATQDLKNLRFTQRDAISDAQSLAGLFGVALPTAVGQLLSRLKGVQAAISAAFPVALVAAAVAGMLAAIGSLVIHFDILVGRARQLRSEISQFGLGAGLLQFIGVGQIAERRAQVEEQQKSAVPSFERSLQFEREAALARIRPRFGEFESEFQTRRILANLQFDLQQFGVARGPKEIAALRDLAAARIQAAQAAEALAVAEKDYARGLAEAAQVRAARRENLRAAMDVTRLEEELARARAGLGPDVSNIPGILRTAVLEREAADRSRAAELNISLETLRTRIFPFEREQQLRQQFERFAEAHHQMVERMADDFENFYQRTIAGARSWADFFRNIMREAFDSIRRSLFQALAGLFTGGIAAPQTVFGAGGGQVLFPGGFGGGIFGGIFGGGGPPGGFGGDVLNSPFIFRAFEPQGAEKGPEVPGGRLRAFLSSLALSPGFRLLPFMLGLTLGGRSQNPLLSAGLTFGGIAGGFAGAGAIAGVIGGAGAGPGALAGLGALFTNPIGLAIAGGLAAFMGLRALFTRGKAKEQASQIADRGFAEIRRIVEQYKAFQLDYGSAIAAMQQIWGQMVAQWSGMGGVGQRSINDQSRWFGIMLDQVNQIEQARGIRGNIIRGLPVPSFQHGGFVATGGFVHPGEFVLSARAVEKMGMALLQRLNSPAGASGSGGGLELSPASAAWIADVFERDPGAADRGLMVVVRAGGKFSRAVRS